MGKLVGQIIGPGVAIVGDALDEVSKQQTETVVVADRHGNLISARRPADLKRLRTHPLREVEP